MLRAPTFSIIIRCLWLLILIISLYACANIALKSIQRYKTESTVVSLERDYYYWRTETTAVTICPMERLNRTLFEEFCHNHNISTIQQKVELFDFLEQLANSTYMNFDKIPQNPSVDNTLDKLNLKPENYMKLLLNLTGDATQYQDSNYRVRTIYDDVEVYARQVLTEWGLCYMTNSILGLEVTAEFMINGHFPEASDNLQKDYTVRPGTYLENRDIVYNFIGFQAAMNIFIHSTFEIMHIERSYGYFDGTQDFGIETRPIVTEENFQERTTVSQRKCRFADESNLLHFPVYTKVTCMQECRLNLAYKLCKCIPHFYPNNIKHPKKVCHYKVLRTCFLEKSHYFHDIFRYKHEGFQCNCLDNCVDADVYISQSHPTFLQDELSDSRGVIIRMSYFPTYRLKRHILFTLTDLLVSIGGTAGLFLGFSILCIIEIVYYFSLRLFWYLRGYKT